MCLPPVVLHIALFRVSACRCSLICVIWACFLLLISFQPISGSTSEMSSVPCLLASFTLEPEAASSNSHQLSRIHSSNSCICMQIHGNPRAFMHPSICMQPHANPCKSIQIRANTCRFVQIQTDLCRPMQTNATQCNCMHMEAHNAASCTRMHIHAYPCKSMQIHANPHARCFACN